MVKVTVLVGVTALGGTPVTFALNVGVLEPCSATGNRLVLESYRDADAAGNETHTTPTGANTKTATSVATPRRTPWSCLKCHDIGTLIPSCNEAKRRTSDESQENCF